MTEEVQGAYEAISVNKDRKTVAFDTPDCVIHCYRNMEMVKPYLRPLSSMTEEEKREYFSFIGGKRPFDCDFSVYPIEYAFIYEHDINSYIDWLNKHHFDYRGLIKKGLALEVTEENNPYK